MFWYSRYLEKMKGMRGFIENVRKLGLDPVSHGMMYRVVEYLVGPWLVLMFQSNGPVQKLLSFFPFLWCYASGNGALP